MARYRGFVQGSGATVSRTAYAKTGMRVACGGKSIGASVDIDPKRAVKPLVGGDHSEWPEPSELDEIYVNLTRGQPGRKAIYAGLIATIAERAGQPSLLTFYNPTTGEQITTIDVDA